MIRSIAWALLFLAVGAAITFVTVRRMTHAHPVQPAGLNEYRRTLDDVLETRLDRVRFERQELSRAVISLADQAHVNVAVNWEDGNGQAQRLVTIDMKDVTLHQALDSVLAPSSPYDIGYAVHNGVLCIGHGANGWWREAETRAYDIRDLMDDYIAYDLRPSPAPGKRTHPPTTQDCQEAVNRIAKYIDSNASGGRYLEMTEFAGRLLITATSEGHEQIRACLERLRRGSDKGVDSGRGAEQQP